MIDNTLFAENLRALADRYETPRFLHGDPSWFMHKVQGTANQEVMAFLAACLSFGSRVQFLTKVERLLIASKSEPWQWVRSGNFARFIPESNDCFYRMYTFSDIHQWLQALSELLVQYGTLGDFAREAAGKAGTHTDVEKVLDALSGWFAERGVKGIVPRPFTSVCKRPCMFLRWMVRSGSPVDLGLWREFIDPANLIIPLDTHVLQVSRQLGFIQSKSANWRTAVELTRKMAEYFPGDPARADFALFGLGVSKK